MSYCRCVNCGLPINQNLCICGTVNSYLNLPYSYQSIQQVGYVQPVIPGQTIYVPYEQIKKRSTLGCVATGFGISSLILFIIALFSLLAGTGFMIFTLLMFVVSGILGIIDLAMGENVQPYKKIISDDVVVIVLGSLALISLIIMLASI